jgi:DNA-binding NtrC family response regulator
LLELAGHTVIEAPQGEAAMAVLRDHPGRIDLVITDVLMPGMTGRDVVEATRRMRPEAAVLYVSGHAGDVLARAGGDAAAPFLQKPFSAADLHAAVRRALEGAKGSRS